MMNWHTTTTHTAFDALASDQTAGLTTQEASARTAKYGKNELVDSGGRTPLKILWEQLTATMVLILIGAAILAAILSDTKNAVAISAIVILYTLLGFIQEYRAEQAIASLKRMSSPNVRVIRDGKLTEVPAEFLVPGDVVQLESGNIVPADLRLIEVFNLTIQESALTGESEPVAKQAQVMTRDDLPLGDRFNMAYRGTIVSQGRGLGLVVATGMETELGKIAQLIQQAEVEPTPLQRRLDQLGKMLAVVGVVIAALVFVIGIWRGDELRHMLLTAVSVAVAIVPEGLPAVVTITLAIGAQRMLRRKALIRKLPAVETLGSVTVICSDKTGTLTENRMTVMMLDVAGHQLDLTEQLKGNTVQTNRPVGIPAPSPLSLLVTAGALCNDASFIDKGSDSYSTIGDPTEGALIAAAARLGYWKEELDHDYPRYGEIPFDSDRKRMSTIHTIQNPATLEQQTGLSLPDESLLLVTKGSVDGLLQITNTVHHQGKAEPITPAWKQRIETANADFARKGMRVLGVAYRRLKTAPANPTDDLEQELTFVGMFAMIDPPRPEVKQAVALTKTAGIHTVMITGDHPLTAAEIARQLGISDSSQALTGIEIDQLSDTDLKAAVKEVRVFARVSPEHKLKIIQALQENGDIVSMTGDGVNDAPALRRADIGVAMGITGTDVSKEAADVVLLDDNFATIVAAVQEGRTIYDNIRKFVRFSVAGNIGKVLVMLLAPFLGKPIPLIPLQLLWLNLLTDGLLGLGLGMEPPEEDTMQRPPYSPQESVFSRGAALQTAWIGVLMGAIGLAVGAWYYFSGQPQWQTMVFTTLAFVQVGQALATRTNHRAIALPDFRANPLMLGMLLTVTLLQFMAIYLPPLQTFFNTQALSPVDIAVAVAIGGLVWLVIELSKKPNTRA